MAIALTLHRLEAVHIRAELTPMLFMHAQHDNCQHAEPGLRRRQGYCCGGGGGRLECRLVALDLCKGPFHAPSSGSMHAAHSLSVLGPDDPNDRRPCQSMSSGLTTLGIRAWLLGPVDGDCSSACVGTLRESARSLPTTKVLSTSSGSSRRAAIP